MKIQKKIDCENFLSHNKLMTKLQKNVRGKGKGGIARGTKRGWLRAVRHVA